MYKSMRYSKCFILYKYYINALYYINSKKKKIKQTDQKNQEKQNQKKPKATQNLILILFSSILSFKLCPLIRV